MKHVTLALALLAMTGCTNNNYGIITYRNGVMNTHSTNQRTKDGSNSLDTKTQADNASNEADKKLRGAAALTGSGPAAATENND